MSIKLLTSGDLDLLSVVLYTFRCSFSRIFEVIGGLVQASVASFCAAVQCHA